MGLKYGKSNPRDYPHALSKRQAYAIWKADNDAFAQRAKVHSEKVKDEIQKKESNK